MVKPAWTLAAACLPVLLSGGAIGQERMMVSVDPATCRLLERHVPAPDVAYEPGVDVHGDPVTPADLTPRIRVPRHFAFDVTVDPFDYSGHDRRAGSRFEGTDMPVGEVAVDTRTGEVTYEGQVVRAADRKALVLACRGWAR